MINIQRTYDEFAFISIAMSKRNDRVLARAEPFKIEERRFRVRLAHRTLTPFADEGIHENYMSTEELGSEKRKEDLIHVGLLASCIWCTADVANALE